MDAIFTLLYNPDYIPGALVLARKLQELGNYHLGLLIDKSNFTRNQLSKLSIYDELIDIQPIVSTDDKLTLLNRPELNKTWSKIQLWNLIQYNKILYLDCDTLPLNDKIFNLFKVDFPKSKILASPDSGFPDIFNSGMMVLKPNLHDYNNLLNLIKFGQGISFDGADQGLLNQYFNRNIDWLESYPNQSSSNWIKLPFLYNCTPSIQYQYLPAYNYFTQTSTSTSSPPPPPPNINDSIVTTLNDYFLTSLAYYQTDTSIKLLHYIGPVKPWNSLEHSGIFETWWLDWQKYYGDDLVHDVVYGDKGNISEGMADNSDEDVITDNIPREISIQNLEPQSSPAPQTPQAPPAPPEPHLPSPESFHPTDLLNPDNYSHFESNITIAEDSHWDPATESPPATEPHDIGFSNLEQGMRGFINKWDESEPETPKNQQVDPVYINEVLEQVEEQQEFELTTTSTKVHQEVSPDEGPYQENNESPEIEEETYQDEFQQQYLSSEDPPTVQQVEREFAFGRQHQHQHQEEEEEEEEKVYSGTTFPARYVKAERVFDDEDYKPIHRLQPVEKIEIKPMDESFPELADTLYQESSEYSQTQEKFIKLGIVEDDGFEEIYDENDDEMDDSPWRSQSTIPKLFPWEFKDDAKPERVFD